jgi:hypothetical protein
MDVSEVLVIVAQRTTAIVGSLAILTAIVLSVQQSCWQLVVLLAPLTIVMLGIGFYAK